MVERENGAAAQRGGTNPVFQFFADRLKILAQGKFIQSAFEHQLFAILLADLNDVHARVGLAGVDGGKPAFDKGVDHSVHVAVAVLREDLSAVLPRGVPGLEIVGLQEFQNMIGAEQRTGLSGHVFMNAQIVDRHNLTNTPDHFYAGIADGGKHIFDQFRLFVTGDAEVFFAHQLARLVKTARNAHQRQIAFVTQSLGFQQAILVDAVF